MSRRRVKPIASQRIAIVDRSQLDPLARLGRAVEILQTYDPDALDKVIEAADALAALHGDPSEQEIEAEFQRRIARIRGEQRPTN